MKATPSKALITQPQMGGAGLRTFYRIAEEWGLTQEEQIVLLGTASSTFYNWKKKVLPEGNIVLGRDTLERLSYLLGIYKALRILLPQSYAGWVKRPNNNPLFGGKSALSFMLHGNVADLFRVRQHLDAWRGGWS